jgi:hypothetical protein
LNLKEEVTMFERIREGMAKMEYGCNLQSLIVFIPVASLIALKAQHSYLHNVIKEATKDCTPEETLKFKMLSLEWEELHSAACYHILGSTIQTITLLALATLHPLFLAPCLLSFYEACSSCHQLFDTNSRASIPDKQGNPRKLRLVDLRSSIESHSSS